VLGRKIRLTAYRRPSRGKQTRFRADRSSRLIEQTIRVCSSRTIMVLNSSKSAAALMTGLSLRRPGASMQTAGGSVAVREIPGRLDSDHG
jgi:hypothetical protein